MKKKAWIRISGILLALMCCVGGLQVAAASSSSSSPIVGFSTNHTMEEMFALGESQDPGLLEVYPGMEIRIPITADMFEWANGRNPAPMEASRAVELKTGKVRIKTIVRSGSEALDYIQLNTGVFPGKPFLVPGKFERTGKTSYISIRFAEKLQSTEDVKFTYIISLTANGDASKDFEMTVSGIMMNEKIEINENTDYVKIYDNHVAVAVGYRRDVKFDLGSGVTIHKHAIKGEKYYGYTGIVDNMAIIRESYPDIYPMVEAVYKLETVNLRYSNEGVTIKPRLNPDKPHITSYYVYNEDLVYLGTTKDILYYSDVYILTSEKLPDMDETTYEETLINPPTRVRA